MSGETQGVHQGEPGYIGAVTRISGMAEAKARTAGESGEQDKAEVVSQDTPAEEAQSPAAVAAPVGAAQQPPDRMDGEDELLAQQLEMSRPYQAGAPVLQREDVLDTPSQTGNAQATGLSRSKLDELYEKIRPGVEERYRKRAEQQEKEVTRPGHVTWDIPIRRPLLSSTPQGALGASGDVLGGTGMVAGERRKAQAFKVSEKEGAYLSFLGQNQAVDGTPVSRSLGITDREQVRLELQRELQKGVEERLLRNAPSQHQEPVSSAVQVKQECITPGRDGEEEVVDLHFPLRWNEATRSFAPPVLPASPGASVPEGAQVEGFAGADGQVLASDLPEEGECEDEQQEKEKEEEWVKNLLEERDRQIAILKETRDAGILAQQKSEAFALKAKQKLEELGAQLHTTKTRHDAVVREFNEQVSLLQEQEEKICGLEREVRQWKQQAEKKDEEIEKLKREVQHGKNQLDEKEGELLVARDQLGEMERKLKATEEMFMLQGETLIETRQEVARLRLAPAERPSGQPPCYADSVKREQPEEEMKFGERYPEVVRGDYLQYGEPARERNRLEMPGNNPQVGQPSLPPSGSAAAGRGGGVAPSQPEYSSCGRGARGGYTPSMGVTFDRTRAEYDSRMEDLVQELREDRAALREIVREERAELRQRVRALEAPVAPVARTQLRFNGKPSSESWTAWWKKFSIANQHLTAEQRALALWNSLEGPALELVAGSAPSDNIPAMDTMVNLLTARYAPVELEDKMLSTLLQRRQKPGEKWIDYSEALTQIYNAANPKEGDSAERRKLLYSAFLAGVCDKQMVVQLRIWRSGQGYTPTPLLADVAKYCASIAGSVPENCDRFEGERVKEERETTTEQNRGARGRGNRVARIAEGATSGEAEVLRSVKDVLRENKKQLMKEMKEMQGAFEKEMQEVKGDIRAVQQTPSTIVAQPASARSESAPWFGEPREYPSGGYQRYDGTSRYRSGAGGRGYGGRGGRGTARPANNSYGNERCFSCGGTGHFGRDCCGEEVPGVNCFKCGGRGHFRSMCPNWYEASYNASRGRGGRGSYSRGGYRDSRGGRGRGSGPIAQEASEQQGNQ